MTRILSETSFVAFHEDFRQEFRLQQIAECEDIEKWIEMNAHSNICTAFERFYDKETGFWFSVTEFQNGGSMFSYIKSL